jgi:hypothetical protein
MRPFPCVDSKMRTKENPRTYLFQPPARMDQPTNLAASKSSGIDHAIFDVLIVSKKRKASETTAVDESNMMHMAKYRKTN